MKLWTYLTVVDDQTQCTQNLQKWKYPEEIIFDSKKPNNTMEKILKEVGKNIFVKL